MVMINKNFSLSDITKVNLGKNEYTPIQPFEQALLGFVVSKLDSFRLSRDRREEIWTDCWAQYFGTPETVENLRSKAFQNVGNVNVDWRHRLNTNKAYEQVETVVAYLQQAFFPNRDWFDVIPTEPGYAEEAVAVKKLVEKKLRQANFVSHWEMFLRQLTVTGLSAMALPWRYETKRVKQKVKINSPSDPEAYRFEIKEIEKVYQNNHDFQTLDIFDVYVDPTGNLLSETDVIRRIIKTRSEVSELAEEKYFRINKSQIINLQKYDHASVNSGRQYEKQSYLGNNQFVGDLWNDQIEIFEFWGDVYVNNTCYKDVVVTWSNGTILRFENNPLFLFSESPCQKKFLL